MIGRIGDDIPLRRDGTVRDLPWLIAPMVYLAALALAGMLALNGVLDSWDRGLSGTMTVELPPAPVPPATDDAVAKTLQVLRAVGGSLTVTLWGAEADTPEHRRLVRAAQAVTGRLLFGGVPTGVAVTAAQQHGGPWPSSTNAFTTSVGDAALARFLRPVALQDAPAWLIDARGQA